MTEAKFRIKISRAPIVKGFIRIPRQQAKEFFPATKGSISIFFDDSASAKSLTYSAREGRIFGATEWLKLHTPGQEAEIEVIERNRVYRIRRIGPSKSVPVVASKPNVAVYKLTKKPLEMGFLPTPKPLRHLFPQTRETVRITVIFEDTGEISELSYNGHYQRLFGLTAWYRKNRAQVGDTIIVTKGLDKCPECGTDMENHDPEKHAISHWGPEYTRLPPESEAYKRAMELTNVYHFRLETSRARFLPTMSPEVKVQVRQAAQPVVQVTQRRTPSMYVGQPLNFRGLVYEPVNENGVIFLFGLVARDLGFYVEGIQGTDFPDAFGKRKENGRLKPVTIEFKFKSSGYKQYYKEGLICDVVVCWQHDWKDCPVEVIELQSKIKGLTS